MMVQDMRNWLTERSDGDRLMLLAELHIAAQLAPDATNENGFPDKILGLPSLSEMPSEQEVSRRASTAVCDDHFIFLNAIAKSATEDMPSALEALAKFVTEAPGVTYEVYSGSRYDGITGA
jgi:hypothetical protein